MRSAFARWNHVNGSLLCLEWDGRQKAPCGDCRKASKGAARAVGLSKILNVTKTDIVPIGCGFKILETACGNGRKKGRKEGRKEGTCLFDIKIIYDKYLYATKNSQETVAKAKQSHQNDNCITG